MRVSTMMPWKSTSTVFQFQHKWLPTPPASRAGHPPFASGRSEAPGAYPILPDEQSTVYRNSLDTLHSLQARRAVSSWGMRYIYIYIYIIPITFLGKVMAIFSEHCPYVIPSGFRNCHVTHGTVSFCAASVTNCCKRSERLYVGHGFAQMDPRKKTDRTGVAVDVPALLQNILPVTTSSPETCGSRRYKNHDKMRHTLPGIQSRCQIKRSLKSGRRR